MGLNLSYLLKSFFFVPRSSRSRTFFHSSIPRGIDFITPRLLESSSKFTEDLEYTKFCLLALKYENKEKIFRNLSRFFSFYFCSSGLPINFWYCYLTFWTLKYKFKAENFFDFFFKIFLNFWGIIRTFGITHSSKIPRGPRGIDFIFLDPRGM